MSSPLYPQQMNPNPQAFGAQGPINNPINNPMPQQGGPMNFMQRMIFNNLYNNNPQFRQFADSMQGKNPDQEFQNRGLDYSQYSNIGPDQLRNMMGM